VSPIQRIAVLWEHVTGYVQAALEGLLANPDIVLFVVQRSEQKNALFQANLGERVTFLRLHDLDQNDRSWLSALLAFAPQICIISGTPDPRYREAARLVRASGGVTVWADDRMLRSWWRDAYQRLVGLALHRWRDYQVAFVPGAAGEAYARSIGFPKNTIAQGLYTCDIKLFRPVGNARHTENTLTPWPKVFLFLGQFIRRKGLDHLLCAYAQYRQRVSDPWQLWCVGAGPLSDAIEHVNGAHRVPFAQPAEVASLMGRVGALVIPSRWDHWPLVIHEATSAGLPVIASTACGSSRDLIREGVNGFTFPVGDLAALVDRMQQISEKGIARRMGEASLVQAARFSPQRFASTVLDIIPSMAHGTD
jgi:glycosyltransferase involved in cell wall biosynthesis